ncbi:MAG TPA: metallophosphoesterase [Planktothrix sp.]|jgi:Icc-related predicted phosphoesterase
MADILRIAAVGDVHCRKTSVGDFQPMFKEISQCADMLLLCGDVTDNGTAEEAHVLLKEMSGATKIPTILVLGNHDFESGKQDEMKQIFSEAGLNVLDGESIEINGVGFAGVKGFAGGFGNSMLGPWGEEAIKSFVHEAVNEALKLEAALARLRTEYRIAVMHYSPIQATVEGERVPIYAFLGSSRLEEPINRHNVSCVFHGHAHAGTHEGRTTTGIPVYNVAMPLIRSKVNPRGFIVHEIEVSPATRIEEEMHEHQSANAAPPAAAA